MTFTDSALTKLLIDMTKTSTQLEEATIAWKKEEMRANNLEFLLAKTNQMLATEKVDRMTEKAGFLNKIDKLAEQIVYDMIVTDGKGDLVIDLRILHKYTEEDLGFDTWVRVEFGYLVISTDSVITADIVGILSCLTDDRISFKCKNRKRYLIRRLQQITNYCQCPRCMSPEED